MTLLSVWKSFTAKTKAIYWEAPVSMFLSFLFAILFAVAHHVFYLYMDGQPVGDDETQQWVSRAGTGIAFIVKVLFGITTSMAYVQWFWYKIRKTPITLRRVDSLYGVIYEPMKFWHVPVWIKHWALSFLAITTWVLPIASVFTPGAIFVKPKLVTGTKAFTTLEADFSSPKWCQNLNKSYVRPCTDVSFIENLALSSGRITLVPSGESGNNVSYSTSFEGPAMNCHPADPDLLRAFSTALNEYEESANTTFVLMVIVPWDGFGPNMNASFFESLTERVGWSIDTWSTDVARTYLYVAGARNNSILQSCDYHNARYDIQFDLLGKESQQIKAETELLEPLRWEGNGTDGPSLYITQGIKVPGMQYMEYLPIVHYFGQLTQGFSYNWHIGSQPVTSTVLNAYSNNMQFKTTVDTFLNGNSSMDIAAFVDEYSRVYETTLRNFTVSARYGWQLSNLGVDNLLYPEEIKKITVNATVSYLQTQFEYRRMDLAIAYGLSALFSLICMIMGVWAMFETGGSFSHNFSNVLRHVFSLDLEFDSARDVRKGADPLPKEFAQIVLRPERKTEGIAPAKRVQTIR